MNRVLFTSKRGDWCTPPEILDRIRRFAPIGLDPCSNAFSQTNAVNSFIKTDDGLAQNWIENCPESHVIFVNPEYSRGIGKWLGKCFDSAGLKEFIGKQPTRVVGRDVIALVPARVDTKWFHFCFDTAQAICFYRGRIKFLIDGVAGDPSTFPSAFVYWGKNAEQFFNVFNGCGKVVFP